MGRVPNIREFCNPKYPSYSTYIGMFKSWNDAIKEAGLWKKRYNQTHSCDRCRKSFDELEKLGRYPLKEYNEKGQWTRKWDCPTCRRKYDPGSIDNIRKSLRNCRTGNQNPNHPVTKGAKIQLLACELYGWEDLNKKYNNYMSPIDCYDLKTKKYYQVRGKWYDPINRIWTSGSFDNDWDKKYDYMIFFCITKDGMVIERIYVFPWEEILKRQTICISKSPTDSHGNPITPWYEKYRIVGEEELKKANDIWEIVR